MQLADGVQSISLGALRGLLDSRWPTRVSLACCWGLALPAAWVLSQPLGLGPAGVWWGFGAGLAVAAAALTHRLRKATGSPTEPPPRSLPACSRLDLARREVLIAALITSHAHAPIKMVLDNDASDALSQRLPGT